MRTPMANKGGLVTTEKCPQCGRKGTACRPVPMGHWCQMRGLDEDKSLWIHPEPDPVSIVVDNDPDVIAARAGESLAQAEYEKADGAWKDALARLATAKIQARNGAIVSTPTGEVTYTAPSRRDRKREEKMRGAEVEARDQRERAHDVLVKTRQRHREALQSARLVATIKEQGW